jgi:hypothetical protein
MRSSLVVRASSTDNAAVASVLGSIPETSDTVDSDETVLNEVMKK